MGKGVEEGEEGKGAGGAGGGGGRREVESYKDL